MYVLRNRINFVNQNTPMRKLKNSELNRLEVADFKEAKKIPLVVILDNVRSLNNIGSVFRTSDAFVVEKIYLCGITATPPNKDIHKTALGATDSVDWEYAEDTLTLVLELQKQGVEVASIEQAESAVMLQDFEISKNKKYAIVLGNEVKGVHQKVVSASNYCIEIPQFGTKHSLNISVTTGIVLWSFLEKLRL
mgnify:FL=1